MVVSTDDLLPTTQGPISPVRRDEYDDNFLIEVAEGEAYDLCRRIKNFKKMDTERRSLDSGDRAAIKAHEKLMAEAIAEIDLNALDTEVHKTDLEMRKKKQDRVASYIVKLEDLQAKDKSKGNTGPVEDREQKIQSAKRDLSFIDKDISDLTTRMNEVFQLRLRLFGTEELADRDLKWLKHIKKTLSLKVPTVPKPSAPADHSSRPVTPPPKRKRDDAGDVSPSVKSKKTKTEKKESEPPEHETPKTPPKPLQKKTKIILKTRRAPSAPQRSPSPMRPKEHQWFDDRPRKDAIRSYYENVERAPKYLDRASQVPYVNDDEEIEI